MFKKTVAIAITWLVLIGGIVFWQEYTFFSAKEIVVKTVPVDPYDFFRGNYVTLSYEFSRGKTASGSYIESAMTAPAFSGATLQTLPSVAEHASVYAVLKEQNGQYVLDYFSKEIPAMGTVFIHGTVQYLWGDSTQIVYGIEEFFVPDGEGKKWEAHSGKDLMVRLLVSPDGKARVKELFLREE